MPRLAALKKVYGRLFKKHNRFFVSARWFSMPAAMNFITLTTHERVRANKVKIARAMKSFGECAAIDLARRVAYSLSN